MTGSLDAERLSGRIGTPAWSILTGAFYPISGLTRFGAADSPASSTANAFAFDSSRVVPTAYENRPASVSALVCISY